MMNDGCSVPAENIPGINLILHVIQRGIISVCNDAAAHGLEPAEIIHYQTSEKCSPVIQRRFVYYHRSPSGLDTLHHSLYGTLAEIVGVGLHGKPVYPHHDIALA